MALLPKIGRRSLKIRLVIFSIYGLLIAGSITMIYPFLIMLSGSVKGQTDIERMDLVPRVLYSEQVQFARFMEDRYGTLTVLSTAFGEELLKNDRVRIPEVDSKALSRYRQFLDENIDEFPDHFYVIQDMTVGPRILPRNFRKLRDEIRRECTTVGDYNEKYKSSMSNWNDFAGLLDMPTTKEFMYENNPLTDHYLKFKRKLPRNDKVVLNIDGLYFNMQKSYPQVRNGKMERSRILPATMPKGDDKVLWAEFVKHNLNCLFVRLDPEGLKLFRRYLAEKYPAGVADMNKMDDTSYRSFDAVNASYAELRNSALNTHYTDFITDTCPPEHLIVDSPSTRYREYVGSATAIPPFVAEDYAVFKQMKKPFMKEILTRNYINVIQYVVVYGRAIFNTVIFIGLSIGAALLVNPLAAYALSRFRLKSTYTLLMFFLGTMAFPGAVTMIPNFLLLKNLGLLNTFWALILPVVANGYSIFILKGFFDSIPREIYESAMLDGASEWTMFWRFTMALSTPILALIALGAFTAAYTAFMFALIICPDEKMWTLMVWLYQMQQDAHQSVTYAALVLAAIPTLLMFILAQNVIMKGIVVPVEK